MQLYWQKFLAYCRFPQFGHYCIGNLKGCCCFTLHARTRPRSQPLVFLYFEQSSADRESPWTVTRTARHRSGVARHADFRKHWGFHTAKSQFRYTPCIPRKQGPSHLPVDGPGPAMGLSSCKVTLSSLCFCGPLFASARLPIFGPWYRQLIWTAH